MWSPAEYHKQSCIKQTQGAHMLVCYGFLWQKPWNKNTAGSSRSAGNIAGSPQSILKISNKKSCLISPTPEKKINQTSRIFQIFCLEKVSASNSITTVGTTGWHPTKIPHFFHHAPERLGLELHHNLGSEPSFLYPQPENSERFKLF